ncbi:MAG: hypothetical protein B7Y95_22815, partial [Rhizobiales bacterium 32-66-11]
LGLVETVPHPTLGPLAQLSSPLKMAGAEDGWIRRSPPLLGQHTREVLENYGYAPAAIQALEARGVVAQAAPPTGADAA